MKKYCYIRIEGQYDLDIDQSGDLPININKQFASSDLEDNGSGGVYTFTFSAPASKGNIKILKRLFPRELQIAQTISTNPPQGTTNSTGYPLRNAEIIINGLPIYSGQIALLNGKSFDIPGSYEFTFYSDNADWITQIKGKTLDEIKFYNDLGEEQKINFTYNQIKNDNANFPATNPYWCYPVISYGAMGSYQYNIEGDIVESDPDINTANPGIISIADLRPALSIRQMIIEIFRQFNYKVESDFLNGNFFKRLIFPYGIGEWIIKEKKEIAKDYSATLTYQHGDNTNGSEYLPVREADGTLIGSNAYTRFQPPHDYGKFDSDDPQNMFVQDDGTLINPGDNDSTFTECYFLVPMSGLWDIKIDLFVTHVTDARKESKRANPYVEIVRNMDIDFAGRYKGGEILRKKEFQNDGNIAVYGTETGKPFNLNEGDKIYFHVYGGDYQKKTLLGHHNTSDHFIDIMDGSKISISFSDHVVTDGKTTVDPISVSDTLPSDQTQIDFLRGIFHLFNLIAETDTQKRTVRIEPRNDVTVWDNFSFGTRGYKGFFDYSLSPEDWTDKTDVSQENISAITTDLAKKVYLSYKGDQKYYTSVYDFGRDFATSDEDKKENPFFSQILHVRDGNISEYFNKKSGTSDPVIPLYMPKMWDGDKDDNGNFPTQTFQHDPAILFYQGRGADPQNYGNVISDADKTIYIDHFHFGLSYVVCYDDTLGISPSLSFCTEYLGKKFNPEDETKWIKVNGLAELFYLQYFAQLRDGIRLTIPLYLKDIEFILLNSRKLKMLFGRSYILEQFTNYNPTIQQPTKFQLLYAKPSEYLDYINLQTGNKNDDVGSSDDGVNDESPTPTIPPDIITVGTLYFASYIDASGSTTALFDGYEGAQVLYADRDGSPLITPDDFTWDPDNATMTFGIPLNIDERVTVAFVCKVDVTAGQYDGFYIKNFQNTGSTDLNNIDLGSDGYDILYADRNGTDLYPLDVNEGYTDYDIDTGVIILVDDLHPDERLQFVGIKQFPSTNMRSEYHGAMYVCLTLAGETNITVPQMAGCLIVLMKRGIYTMEEGTDYTRNINTGNFSFVQPLSYNESIIFIGHKTIII